MTSPRIAPSELQAAATPPGPRQRGRALIALGFLLAVAAPLIFSGIAHEVKDVVEERVAITAREMWRAREWVLPTLNGRPRLEKPPLAYWLVEATAFLRGEFDDFTLRLPFAILALGTLSFAFGTGRLLLGIEGGLLGALVLLTSALFIRESRMATADAALFFCASGWWFFHVLARTREREGVDPRRARIASFAFLGLGAAAKGPVILVLTLLPVLVEAAVLRSREPLRALSSLAGAAILLLLGLAWPILLVLRMSGEGSGIDAIHQWYLESFGKMVSSDGVVEGYRFMKHPQPWHFYLTRFAFAMGLWSWALPFAWGRGLWMAAKDTRAAGPGRTASPAAGPAIWLTVLILFFSLVREKKSSYMLPFLLPAALLVAAWLTSASPRLRARLRVATRVLIPSWLAAGFAVMLLYFSPWLLDGAVSILGAERGALLEDLVEEGGPLLGLVSAASACGFLLVSRLLEGGLPYRPFIAFGAAVALIAVPYGAVQGGISKLVSLEPQDAPLREECELAARLIRPGEKVYAVGSTMSSLPGGMVYYLDVPVRFVSPLPLEDLGRRLAELPAGSWLLVPRRRLEPCLSGPVPAREPGDARLGGPFEGHRLVTIVNPGAVRDRDLVYLLKK